MSSTDVPARTSVRLHVDRSGRLPVSNVTGGAAGASSATSYRIRPGGDLAVISAVVPMTQTAACWLAIHPNGKFAYTTNTGSGTLSSHTASERGRLT